MKMSNNEWKKTCAACAEGTPPERCAYYGDPNGCNAPTLGKHPEGDIAERLQDELEKAEHRIAELERATGSAAALREALEEARKFLLTNKHGYFESMLLPKIDAALAAPPRNCDRPFRLFEEAIGAYVSERGDGPHLGYCDAIKWMLDTAEGGVE
jgi:hypothetical protein